MSTNNKHCDTCGNLMHPTVGCINPACLNHKSFASMAKRMGTAASSPDIDIQLDTPPPSSPPVPEMPSGPPLSGTPTNAPPPLERALNEYLAKPRGERDAWPDNSRCVRLTCRRPLLAEFAYCPYCGRMREAPSSVKERAREYRAQTTADSPPPLRQAIRPPASTTYSSFTPREETVVIDPSKKPRR